MSAVGKFGSLGGKATDFFQVYNNKAIHSKSSIPKEYPISSFNLQSHEAKHLASKRKLEFGSGVLFYNRGCVTIKEKYDKITAAHHDFTNPTVKSNM